MRIKPDYSALRFLCFLFIVVLISSLLSACTTSKGEKLKSDLVAALNKHSELDHYRFQGSAQIELPANEENEQGINAILGSSLADATWTWQGALHLQQNQLEADLTIAPASADVTFELPLIWYEQKLYIPLAPENGQRDGWELELGHTSPANDLQQLNSLFIQSITAAVEVVDVDAFTALDESGSSFQRIHIAVTEENASTLLTDWLPGLNNVQEALSLPKTTLTEQQLQSINVTNTSGLTFVINDAGYIISYEFELHYQIGDDPATAYSLSGSNHLKELNEQPQFQKPIPEHAEPLIPWITEALAE